MSRTLRWLTRGRSIVVVAILGFSCFAQQSPDKEISQSNVLIESIADDRKSMRITDCPKKCDGAPSTISVKDVGLQDRLKDFHAGDHASITYVPGKEENALKTLAFRTTKLGFGERAVVFCGSGLVLFVLAALFSLGHPSKLLLGEDNRYSNSKFQIASWFFVLLAAYLSNLVLRAYSFGMEFWGGVNIPANLLLLSGLSAVTFGAAKGITTAKVQDAVAQGIANPKQAAASPSLLRDFAQNDAGQFDLGDFQMIIVTLIALATYSVLIFSFLASLDSRRTQTLPDVDTTILATFGLGQGAYLTKKAVSPVGS